MKINLSILFLFLVHFCVSASAQSPLWNGTWIVDDTQNQTKTTFSFTKQSDGLYAFTDSKVVYQFRCDGKPYPLWSRGLEKEIGKGTCHSLSASSLDVTFDPVGQRQTLGHLQVSSDGKALTYTLETVDAEKKKQVRSLNYARVSGGPGLIGGWRTTAPNLKKLLRLTLSTRGITLEFPLTGDSGTTMPLSGAEAHVTKKGALTKVTLAMQMDGQKRFHVTSRESGIVTRQTVYSLASDGSTITESSWMQQHPEQIASYTYYRSK